ncbi:DUF2207 domain-containing protein [Actinomadura verrucosospora]|uniref:Transmembrane signal peptide protein n=1 Tax=Actinomadura verrucosospora TaxID=46165 RepID=A0A7D4A4Q2_ACTVE|nr:DUF2207 domain-containing protein [Actinomadura verrucosospora]QKG20507.1 transmembrane signal peptide protein [Actinomadura verrucosospora]
MAWPAQAMEEHIRDYRADLTIRPNGLVHVHEVIAYDFGDARDRHGIERVVPDRDGRRLYDIEHVQVTADGKQVESRTAHGADAVTIRIGDEHVTVSGVRTYAIDYDVARALTPHKNHDELYWDAIGTGWSVPIDAATVRVNAPAALTYASCFAGREGGHDTCGGRTVSGNNASFGQRLGTHQGMTVEIGLPKGAAHVPSPRYDRPVWAVTWVGYTVLGLVCAFLLGCQALVGWRRRPRQGSDLPALVGPAEVALFRPQRRRPRFHDDHAAVLVDLAVRGHLHIRDNGKWLTLTRRSAAEPSRPYERALLEAVFPSKDKVRLSAARREEISSSVPLHRMTHAALRDRKLVRRFGGYDYEVAQRVLGIAALAAGLVLIVVDLWGRLNSRSFSVSDLTAVGIALGIAGTVALSLSRRIEPYTFAGTRVRALLEDYPMSARLEQPDGERHLPYAMALGFWSAVEEFGTENADQLDWYTYTGDAKKARERFTALSWLFQDPSHAPTRPSDGRWSSPARRTGQSSSTTYTPPPFYDTGSGGGGYVGGGAGGGSGSSW